jgi:hypothetical protein
MLEALSSILKSPWKQLSRPAVVAWLVFYLAFLGYAFSAHGAFLFIDSANLVVHEGGHNLFGWFGPTLGLWGATLLQCPFSWRHIFSVSGKSPDSSSAGSSFSKTGCTPPPTWRMPGRKCCRWCQRVIRVL